MSTAESIEQIDYPESDGLPMGETDTHRRWMIRILDRLSYRYRDQRVYVASDVLVYYEPGQLTKFIVPDDMVVLDCEPGDRRVFKTWEEQRVPDVVFEVTSRGTSTDDMVHKPIVYERMGVSEYFLYDPTGQYLVPSLQGYRLKSGVLHEIAPVDGAIACQTLGFSLRLDGLNLEMFDLASGERLLTEAEANLKRAEAEQRRAEAEQHRAEAEQHRADKEYRRAEQERAARLVAEDRLRELEAELRRLRGS